MSLQPTDQLVKDSSEMFSVRLDRVLMPGLEVLSDTNRNADGPTMRRVVVCEADPKELQAKAKELTSDSVIEPVLPRVPAIAYPLELTAASMTASQQGPGTGAELKLTLLGTDDVPAAGATAIVRFNELQRPQNSIVAGGVADGAGAVSVAFDPNLWRPTLVVVEPAGRFWTGVARMPQSGQVIRLHDLPQGGPLGWWHLLSGASEYQPEAGRNIKVGVIDTGVGPHPYLAHVTPVGAFLDGSFIAGAAEAADVQTHGTHVCGIIGARPPAGSAAFAGIAPGADVFVARIFTATGGGNQGDVANAIDALSSQFAVDVINMSMTGAPSAIEHDAVIMAQRRGTVCVCAAGNQNGGAVGYPAAYPESIAVSALGLVNIVPADTLPALNLPVQPDKFGYGGIFLASFSNVGPQIFCSAPGNGIISTIPSHKHDDAPYADMSGTSMASPLVAGALADLLSRETAYQAMPRNHVRAGYAKSVLAQHAVSIMMSVFYQGRGLARRT